MAMQEKIALKDSYPPVRKINKKNKSRDILQGLFSRADVTFDGTNPWDIRVLNEELYDRWLSQGSLGIGESYMEGWWECERIDEFVEKILRARLELRLTSVKLFLHAFRAKLFNLQKKSKAFRNAGSHYNVGNDLYQKMLDKSMVYSSAYWKNAASLDEAQENKLELICQKIGLKPGMSVLDIGCGWGSFAKFAAEKYQVKVLGITVSENQVELGRKLCEGLPVEIRLQDYRNLNQKFDRIVSVGMFEHVGYKNYRQYMSVAHRCLKEDGLFLLQTIGSNTSNSFVNPWFQKYIFPNSLIPSVKQVANSTEGLFVMEDWHSFGPNYDKTLMAWFENFERHWPELKEKYGETFYRMWKLYLLSSAGSFRARDNQLWQVLLSKAGISSERIR